MDGLMGAAGGQAALNRRARKDRCSKYTQWTFISIFLPPLYARSADEPPNHTQSKKLHATETRCAHWIFNINHNSIIIIRINTRLVHDSKCGIITLKRQLNTLRLNRIQCRPHETFPTPADFALLL